MTINARHLRRGGARRIPIARPTSRRVAHPATSQIPWGGHAFNAVNVVGVVRGGDPTLAGSYVAFGAHYDHIGLSPGAGDTVNNGADDDG